MTEPAELQDNATTADTGCTTTTELIPQLPRIMRNNGWLRAAALMERWQRNPANSNAKHGTPDIHTVSMNWILSFERAARVFDEMVLNRVWVNEAGRELIVRRLAAIGLPPGALGASRKFGELPENICPPPHFMIALHDQFHIQTRQVQQASLTAPIDELTAALANFALHVVAVGEVRYVGRSQAGARYEVSIRRVGIYARDTYDFDDRGSPFPQPLGYWGCSPAYVGKDPGFGQYLDNRAFRTWRSNHSKGHGGDYLVFSDIHWLDTNDSFEFVS